MKINLVLSKTNWTSFHQIAFTDLLSDYFDIVYIEDQTPPKHNSILVSNLTEDHWYANLQEQGYKLIIDLMWGGSQFDVPNAFNLKNPNWFWYHESLLYQRKGYDLYTPIRDYSKTALMPMGIHKESYDQLYDRITHHLDNFVYSYVGRFNRRLPEDAPDNFWTADHNQATGFNQRYFNPAWYDQTHYSLVAETTVSKNFPLHVTEKTFKPIAFQHPFLLWAQPGSLAHLHSIGFESYSNWFDESYDQLPNRFDRLDVLVKNIDNFQPMQFDQLTLDKCLHNKNQFFNKELIKSRIKSEIIDPIIDFFEKD